MSDDGPTIMSPDQAKMARAALGWGTRELKDKCGISHDTLARIERGDATIKEETILKLQYAYEAAGLEFTPHNGVGEGVRWAKPPKKRDAGKSKAYPPAKRKR